MADIPAEAVQAAADAMEAVDCHVTCFTFDHMAKVALEAAAPILAAQAAEEIFTRLRRLAAGRRDYARGTRGEIQHMILCEADALDAAVKVAQGSDLTMLGMIPLSWWTDDEQKHASSQIGEPRDPR